MQKQFLYASTLASLLFLLRSVTALPQDPSVAVGSAEIHHADPHTMQIKTSDKAILNYDNFNINKGEKVQFIQPSSSSCVLNRITGKNGSAILGNLESNGKVFLVNPNGIYFGKDATVNVGSLIASTLNISDHNFLNERYTFFLEDKNKHAEIRNEGFLSASFEGAIVLIAQTVRNLGTIQVDHGSVAIASGELVTLDFLGDGLLNFSVEGNLKEVLIEQLGRINAEQGLVSMKTQVAKKAIQEIANRDGIERGEVFVERDGEIFLVDASSITAKDIEIQSTRLQIDGKLNAKNADGFGGSILFTANTIELENAILDASGPFGGGTITIGNKKTSNLQVSESATLLADATQKGNGGRIILWSEEKTLFDGKIFARGGPLGGDGGFVETSSAGDLQIKKGFVDTQAPFGEIGKWLLDPSVLRIRTSGAIPSACESGTVDVALIEAQPTTIILCANLILQDQPISMTTPGAGITFTAPDGQVGSLFTQGNITTIGGPVTLENMSTTIISPIVIDTTGGGSPGADITFGNIDTDGNLRALTMRAGTGTITVGDLGVTDPFGDVLLVGENIVFKSILTDQRPITLVGNARLAQNSVLNTGGGTGANIEILPLLDSLLPGSFSLSLNAGSSGTVTLGPIGTIGPILDLAITEASQVFMQDVTSSSGSIVILPPVILDRPLTRLSILEQNFDSIITINKIDGTTDFGESLTISSSLWEVTTLGEIGVDVPLNIVSLSSSREISIETLKASDLAIQGSFGTATLHNLEAQDMLLESRSIILTGLILAKDLAIFTQRQVLSGSTSQNIVITEGGQTVISVFNGPIGGKGDPVTITNLRPKDPITLGAKEIAVIEGPALEKNSLRYYPDNEPCLVIFNGVELLNCKTAIRAMYNRLPKILFPIAFYTKQRLGIGYPPLYSGKTLVWSQFEDVNSPAMYEKKPF